MGIHLIGFNSILVKRPTVYAAGLRYVRYRIISTDSKKKPCCCAHGVWWRHYVNSENATACSRHLVGQCMWISGV